MSKRERAPKRHQRAAPQTTVCQSNNTTIDIMQSIIDNQTIVTSNETTPTPMFRRAIPIFSKLNRPSAKRFVPTDAQRRQSQNNQ
jgi:hypothetical protein